VYRQSSTVLLLGTDPYKLENMFFNKYSFHTIHGLRAAPAARSKEQGADGGQGAAAGRTIQAARVTQYIEFHSSAR
jgi:hypothetical protein